MPLATDRRPCRGALDSRPVLDIAFLFFTGYWLGRNSTATQQVQWVAQIACVLVQACRDVLSDDCSSLFSFVSARMNQE